MTSGQMEKSEQVVRRIWGTHVVNMWAGGETRVLEMTMPEMKSLVENLTIRQLYYCNIATMADLLGAYEGIDRNVQFIASLVQDTDA